ncbi:glycine/betaine ABC transporter ATP-binding protein [Enterococcus florum]|uniref:Quaternary amine transport ATP-binding protein n=1 Tax=Enterococcus florum TaxID=2480627 RepID=A0A4P5PEU7_9ENTE|nr:ABC transporter ATP-binding protein [Enterococcus florum]GCF94871.1 glycine/betaine ABC transporter ATP-binding protein [Enterococcus florum]
MIKFEQVDKKYGDNFALKQIDLEINQGEFVCVIGTSGSGKTTLMRMINRMNEPTQGKVLIDGEDVQTYDEVELRRKIGYVIQNIGLFPHMTIRENILIVPKLLKWTEAQKAGIAEELIQKIELPLDYLNLRPKNLSGGQQQRIGVIRALAADQAILLMDEPFGALDPITRESLQELIKKLQADMNKTIVFVTHDMDEALKLSDRIVIMDKGEIIQCDTPEHIVQHPVNEFVETLIGKNTKWKSFHDASLAVRDIMQTDTSDIGPEQTLIEALEQMDAKQVDHLWVVDQHHLLLGMLQRSAISQTTLATGTVQQQMQPIIDNITVEETVNELVYRFLQTQQNILPVIDAQNQLVGQVTRESIAEMIYEQMG